MTSSGSETDDQALHLYKHRRQMSTRKCHLRLRKTTLTNGTRCCGKLNIHARAGCHSGAGVPRTVSSQVQVFGIPPVTETIYTHVISEDGKRIAAQLGNAVWGILDASWTEKRGVNPVA